MNSAVLLGTAKDAFSNVLDFLIFPDFPITVKDMSLPSYSFPPGNDLYF
jgi:hypothetical protein